MIGAYYEDLNSYERRLYLNDNAFFNPRKRWDRSRTKPANRRR